MALAIIEADLGPTGITGMTAKLFAPESDTLVATIPAVSPTNDWVEATNRKGVYQASQALLLTGKYYIQFYNSGGARIGSGYVYLTDAANVHLVVSYASVSDKDGAAVPPLLGPGATLCTINFNTLGVPVPQMAVWLTSDSAGIHTIAGTLYTDANGNVSFLLDMGTVYYLWAEKSGENSILGIPYTATP